MSKDKKKTPYKMVQEYKYSALAGQVKRGKTLTQATRDMQIGYQNTTSKTFQEKMAEILPDDALINEHHGLFTDHRRIREVTINTTDDKAINKAVQGLKNYSIVKNEKQGFTTIIINEPDRQARKDALELAYKIKGLFNKHEIEIKRDFEDLTDDEVIALAKDITGDDKDKGE